MSINVVVPELGESVVQATVLKWHAHEGDAVKAGQALVELETEKVNLEVSAERDGILARILHKEGDDVKIGDVLALVEEKPAESGQPTVQGSPTSEQENKEDGRQRTQDGEPKSETPRLNEQAQVTPVARRMAEEYGIDLSQVPATFPEGRITKQDVQSYVERTKEERTRTEDGGRNLTPNPFPRREGESRATENEGQKTEEVKTPTGILSTPEGTPPERNGREERVRMSRRRQTIARRLVEAQHQAAMLTTFNEIDMTQVMELRRRYKDSFKQRYGIGLGITSFFVKASIGALKAFPRINAEIQGDEMVLKHYYDIGIAVGATEGLVVPVLREADRLSFIEIEKAIGDFANKAENNTLSLEDLRGGTFTLTNGGVFGSLMSTPILNPPQVAILGLHKIEERPIVREGQVVVRPMMYVALSYDHRIVDGREAVQFLVRIKQLIEDPSALLLEA